MPPIALTSKGRTAGCTAHLIPAAIVISVFLAASELMAAPIGLFAPSSLNITHVTGSRTDGNLFSLDFRLTSLVSSTQDPYVTGSSSFGYLNLVAGSSWLVQDEPIPLVADLIGEMNYFWFSSATTDFSGAMAVLSDVPFGGAPTPDLLWSEVGASGSVDWGSNDPHGQTEEAPLPGEPPPITPVIEGYLRGGVPDIGQLRDECGPTSVTNSLLWLIKKYKLPLDKLPKTPAGELDEQELLKRLAKAMKPTWDDTTPIENNNRGYPGLDGNELLDGKTKFIADTMLPITVHGGNTDKKASGAAAFGFVKRELRRGQDVEFLIDWPGPGSHWVTVVGFIDAGKDKKTLVVHDPDDKRTGNAYWKLKDDGTFTQPAGTAMWAVAESPAPEPGLLALFALTAIALRSRLRRKLANSVGR